MTIFIILILLGLLGLMFWLLPLKIFITILMVLQVVNCVLLVTVVLMQRSKSDGLAGGAAFGGGFTEQFFGAGTGTVLVKVTTWLGGAFFGLTLLLAVLFSFEHKGAPGGGKLRKIVTDTNSVSKAAATNSAPVSSAPSTNAPVK
jgi:preprotein translocase subunit SecG